jgi:hypothetical protein
MYVPVIPAVEVKDSVLDPDSTDRTASVRDAKGDKPRVQAIITDNEGNMSTLAHDLQYSKEFDIPDVKFVATTS